MVKLRETTKYRVITAFFWINSIIAVIAASILPTGLLYLTTESRSMAPTITPRDLTVVHERSMNGYREGDIVSFHALINDEARIVTHRIHRLGGNVYITKGDANAAVDEQVLEPRLIIGKVVAVIPEVGSYVRFIKSDIGALLFIILPAMYIIGVEMWRMWRVRQ